MKTNALLLLGALLLSASCSYFQAPETNRTIAAEVTSPLNIDQLLTIKASTYKDSNINFQTSASLNATGVEIKYIEDPKMPSDIAYKIVPTIEDQKYKINLYHSVGAKFDGDATHELAVFLNKAMAEKFISPFSIFELYYNAKAGDFQSLQVLAKLRLSAFEESAYDIVKNEDFIKREAHNLDYWKNMNAAFLKQEGVFNKQAKIKDNDRRAVMDALDKATDDKQFRTLVAKNDRKGAAALLRQYLPWHEMPPFEKLFWENHLAIMADPLPLEDRVLIYRGIDDDIVQVAEEAGKKLTREEAIQEQKIFLMSTMMTKNQGTWNRRLRSLTSMYEKFMGTDNAGSSEFTRAARITTMFVKHSKEPKGSPFLSYTPKFTVAAGFGYKRNTAYFIDPRMMYFNYASKYANEIEFLLPVMSFPDDLAGVYDSTIHAQAAGNSGTFLKELSIKKLEKTYGAKAPEIYERIDANSKKFFAPVMGGKTGAVAAAQPDGKFVSFFKNLLGMPTKQAAEVIDAKSDMACMDLIQLFWK